MAWGLIIGLEVTAVMVDMDAPTQLAFFEAMNRLREDPLVGVAFPAKHGGLARRSVPIGDLGIIGYEIDEEQHSVRIVAVVWTEDSAR